MNSVLLIGRLTKDPDVNYSQSGDAWARFSIAIDRGKDKNGNSRGADFPNIVCFGRTAELVKQYLAKGRLVAIEGRIQTGSYEKDGKKYYTTDVLATRVQFLEWGDKPKAEGPDENIPDGFSQLTDDDIPF